MAVGCLDTGGRRKEEVVYEDEDEGVNMDMDGVCRVLAIVSVESSFMDHVCPRAGYETCISW